MNYFFTSDEHYGHDNIIKYCDRPFASVIEMNNKIITKHNELVNHNDLVIHCGDFTLKGKEYANAIIKRLNGQHIFLLGSHDNWCDKEHIHEIWEQKIEDIYIVACHYAMRVWAKSHYNSWQLFGHSHGKLKTIGKQLDVGVDTNNFYPYSFKQIKSIMSKKENNFNYLLDKLKE